jgi:hypothetical protein
MAEHYLLSYSRLLDVMVRGVSISLEARPAETIDRINAGFTALSTTAFERHELEALLAIAIDRLAIQGVVA